MAAKYSQCERTEQIARGLVKLGWVEIARNKHVRLADPERRRTVTVARTPSDGRAVLNWISQLRREGIDVDALLRGKHDKSKGKHS